MPKHPNNVISILLIDERLTTFETFIKKRREFPIPWTYVVSHTLKVTCEC